MSSLPKGADRSKNNPSPNSNCLLGKLLRKEDPDAKFEPGYLQKEQIRLLARAHPEVLCTVPDTAGAALELLDAADTAVFSLEDHRSISLLKTMIRQGGFAGSEQLGLQAGYVAYIGLQSIVHGAGEFERLFQTETCGAAVSPLVRAKATHCARLRQQYIAKKLSLESMLRNFRRLSTEEQRAPPTGPAERKAARPPPSSTTQPQRQPQRHSRPVQEPTPRPGAGAPPSSATVKALATIWDDTYRRGRQPSNPLCPHCLVYHAPRFVCFLYTLPAHRSAMYNRCWQTASQRGMVVTTQVEEWNGRQGRAESNKCDPTGFLVRDRAARTVSSS